MSVFNPNFDPFASLRGIPCAPWIDEMRRHYAETGTYRPADLRRLLGDPRRGVSTSDEGFREFLDSAGKKLTLTVSE